MLQKLGFASRERRPGATEGVNVLIEKQNQDELCDRNMAVNISMDFSGVHLVFNL
jgi:hypothetical protein